MPPELTKEQLATMSQEEIDKAITQRASEEADKRVRDLGFDEHAKGVIARANAEAKKHREAAEAADKAKADVDAELAKLKQEADARKADEAKAKADADAKALAEANEKKSWQERLKEIEDAHKASVKDIEDALERKLTEREKAAAQKQTEFLEEIKARDAQILMQAVMAEAKQQGAIAEDVVRLLDVSEIKMERGVPDQEAIKKLIADHKANKPAFYEKEETEEEKAARERDERGRFRATPERPKPGTDNRGGVDYAKLSDEEFRKKEEELRRARV